MHRNLYILLSCLVAKKSVELALHSFETVSVAPRVHTIESAIDLQNVDVYKPHWHGLTGYLTTILRVGAGSVIC
jgi:hypothetical protein